MSISCCFTCSAQNCPRNIDFETGTFDGWKCYTGYVSAIGDKNVMTLSSTNGPVYNRHTMFSAPTNVLDRYGGFPVVCPNGSNHSVRLGNDIGGGQAEAISYEFTIPENQNSYSLIYNYAVVFQSPDHRPNEQPRMEIEITNVTDDSVISCASSTFIAVGSSLSGFLVSTLTDTITVLYKDWSSVSVDLSGNAGKTIRLTFKTADCTFRRHFGYAYIDVNTECSGDFIGATYCPGDSVLQVPAPQGYQGYTWYDATLTTVLGTKQVLTLSPPPVAGTILNVKLDPYGGFGCPRTMVAHVNDSLKVVANAGRDTLSCNLNAVPIGAVSKPGLAYEWNPGSGLNNSTIANPFASPDKTTTYIVTAHSLGGGCYNNDTVVVRSFTIDTSLQLIGKAAFCIGYGDSAILKVQHTQNMQWFKDEIAIDGKHETTYRVTLSGTYYALLENAAGCRISTQQRNIVIDEAKPGITYPIEYAIINLPFVLKARQISENVLWDPGTNLSNTTSFTPTFEGASEQMYKINLTTNSGCLTVDTQLVKTVKNVEIYVPTGFTPNNDGINDILRPIVRGVRDIQYFRIFNRSGQMLYEKITGQPGWDGNVKGIPQQAQVVVWMLGCVGLDGVVYTRKGTSVLLR